MWSETQEDKYIKLRREMVHYQIEKRGIRDKRVLDAFLKVPRHLFVDESLRNRAYEDYPLPIGDEQTISQPYTVAFMTDALKLKGEEKVLEIGSGSGYQTAILLELAKEVFCIERLASLAEKAMRKLKELNYSNFHIRVGDGTVGWKEEAPFDAILVAAGSPRVPPSLKEQLAIGGRLIIPVGDRYTQTMTLVTRKTEKLLEEKYLGAFRFVGLIGEEGWSE